MSEYKRLTKRIDGVAHGYCGRTVDIALSGKYGLKRGCFECSGIIDHLANLEDKMESAALIELPFNFQDKVWCVEKNQFTKEWNVRQIICAGIELMYGKIKVLEDIVRTHSLEYVFATKDQAEARLKELRGD